MACACEAQPPDSEFAYYVMTRMLSGMARIQVLPGPQAPKQNTCFIDGFNKLA